MVDRRAGVEFLERVPIAAAMVDATGAIVAMNQQISRLVGRTITVVEGDKAMDFVHADDLEGLATVLLELIDGQHPNGVTCPARVRTADGVWLETVCTGLDLLDVPGFEGVLTLIRIAADGAPVAGGGGWFEAVVGGTDDIVQVVDEHGRFLWASGPIERVLGMGSEAIVGRTIVELGNPAAAELTELWFASVKATPGPNPTVVGGTFDPEGNPVELEVRATNLLHDPEVRGIVLHTRDVSDRVRAAEASRFAVEVLERAPTTIVTTDEEGRITSWNPAAEAVLGWRADEVIGHRFRDLGILTDDSFAAIIAELDRAIHGGLVELETTYFHRDGSLVPIYTVISGTLDTDGVYTGLLVFGLDLRAQFASRSALADTEARWAALSRTTHELLALLEPDVTFRWAGAGFQNLLGLDPTSLVGTSCRDLVHPDDQFQSGGLEAFDRNPGSSFSSSYRFRHADGSWHVFDATITDLRHEPSINALLVSARDVTERVRAEQANRRLADVVDAAGAAVVTTDLGRKILSWNRGAERLLGIPADQAEGSPSPVQLLDGDEDMWLAALAQIDAGHTINLDIEVLATDGRTVALNVTGSAVVDESDVVVGRSFVAIDTSVRRQAEVARAEREQQSTALAALGQRALAGASVADVLGDACELVSRTLRVPHAHVVLRTVDRRYHEVAAAVGLLTANIGRRDPVEKRAWTKRLDDGATSIVVEDFSQADLRPSSIDGTEVKSGVLVAVDGRDGPIGYLGALADEVRSYAEADIGFLQSLANVLATAIERSRVSDEMQRRALHDELTGLPNRTLLLDRLTQALSRLGRRGGTVGLLFVDLDRFKRVNDTLGHGAGDEVLVTTAARLLAAVRTGDTVARTGGDEFLILTEELDTTADATTLAERVAAAVSLPVDVEGHSVHVSASIGVALTAIEVDADALVRDADLAMYRAKESGRSRVQLFDATMRDEAMNRMALEVALREAVEQKVIRVVFQPQVRLTDGEPLGVEALARWDHPRLGAVPPSTFVALAEEIDLLDDITRLVLDATCAALVDARAIRPGFTAAVNLSPRQLGRERVVDLIESVTGRHDLPNDALLIELTETTALDGNVAINTLAELSQRGFKLAIDDFGTGYSSLSRLTRLPVDAVKIDRSFVNGIDTDTGCAAVVSATVSLAAVLGLEVVAEGVETEAQRDRLIELGCTAGQGWLFGGSLEHLEVLAWLRSRTTRRGDR